MKSDSENSPPPRRRGKSQQLLHQDAGEGVTINGRRNWGAKILHGDRKLTPPPTQYPQHFPHYDPPDGRKPQICRSQSSIVQDTMQHLWTQEAKQCKKWGLLQKAKEIDGYAAVIGSALQAAEKLFKSKGLVFDELDSLYGDGDAEEISLFLFMVASDPSATLKQYAPLVRDAAARGDVKFFQRICKTMRSAKRRRNRDTLKIHVLIHWIASSLWLASDSAGSIYLRQVLNKDVSETSYVKARQRLKKLGLRGYSVAHKKPLITGCTKQATFTYREGWTNLVPCSSR